MPVDLPAPIAIYMSAANWGDTEALAQCFSENAVVRNRLAGRLPGSPIDVQFIFKLEGSKIASLEIR